MTHDEASIKIREASVIAYAAERSFRVLQRLSPATYLGGRRTELYIVSMLLAGVLLGIAHSIRPGNQGLVACFLFIVAGFRITDIFQATVNIGVFDHLGQGPSQQVEDVLRSVVLLVFNYFELVFWFGLVYIPLCLKGANGTVDAFYFSAVTQLTVGYGDITPLGMAKVFAPIQAAIGWFLSLLVIARFVTALPNISKNAKTNGS